MALIPTFLLNEGNKQQNCISRNVIVTAGHLKLLLDISVICEVKNAVGDKISTFLRTCNTIQVKLN